MSEPPIIKGIDEMDDKTFLKHWNNRHAGDDGFETIGEYAEGHALLGAMRRLHQTIHTEPRPNGEWAVAAESHFHEDLEAEDEEEEEPWEDEEEE